MEISIISTSGVGSVGVPADVAKDLQDTYEALASLPASRAAVVDFETKEDALHFWRQVQTWSADNSHSCYRKDAKAAPRRVTFKIYDPNPERKRGPRKTVKK